MMGNNSADRFRINEKGNIWRGRERYQPGLARLFWALVRFGVGSWLWGTALRLAPFPAPTNNVGAAVALLAIIIFVWAIWGVWQAVLMLGVRRLGILIVLSFALIVSFNVLTIYDERPLPSRLWVQISAMGQEVGDRISEATTAVINAPDEFQFAYNGRRLSPELPPGFPTPDPAATPVRAVLTSAGDARPTVVIPTPIPTLRPGNQ